MHIHSHLLLINISVDEFVSMCAHKLPSTAAANESECSSPTSLRGVAAARFNLICRLAVANPLAYISVYLRCLCALYAVFLLLPLEGPISAPTYGKHLHPISVSRLVYAVRFSTLIFHLVTKRTR